jgi:hypothetical protein
MCCRCSRPSAPGLAVTIFQRQERSGQTQKQKGHQADKRKIEQQPAAALTQLKPVKPGESHGRGCFFGWFNRHFNKNADRYQHGGNTPRSSSGRKEVGRRRNRKAIRPISAR